MTDGRVRRRALRLLPMLPLLAIGAGCAGAPGGTQPPPGFTADTFGLAGLLSGARATEAGCRALPDGLWVGTADGRRSECIRYHAAGLDGPPPRPATALVWIPGDPTGATYRMAGGRPRLESASMLYELTAELRWSGAEMLSAVMGGLPVVLLARPGMHGSSGDQAQDRHSHDEVELLDAALTELRRRHPWIRDFAAVGFSSGGTVLANLLTRRADIRCAVLASAPLDLGEYYRTAGGGGGGGVAALDSLAMRDDLADPMRALAGGRKLPADATVFVMGDHHDRRVPAAAWEHWAEAARRAGLQVLIAEIPGHDRPDLGGPVETRHHTSGRALEVGYACASGMAPADVQRALVTGEPLLLPRGRRLDGAEIRDAFAGQTLHGTAWQPRALVLTVWMPDGRLYQASPRRPGRRIAELRWWVEGDRLCTSRHGCGEVRADGALLHVVAGDPPRLAATYLAVAGPRPAADTAPRP
ncbi:alpha/beta hydrolase family protein [Caldovatus aquaticus]|uniref:Peptidase S9 prolyl oligopeptidase catalytic domain-containing protein n=1 Tax=Caldovatus aquaticus TaxID=2865671 RepID=A0ABS7F2W8_9PROT|nr:hypothetical protein [Caldovatus aquaticus]MBW8269839.1 hypothetical protein [Caldovatus aquaticus]